MRSLLGVGLVTLTIVLYVEGASTSNRSPHRSTKVLRPHVQPGDARVLGGLFKTGWDKHPLGQVGKIHVVRKPGWGQSYGSGGGDGWGWSGSSKKATLKEKLIAKIPKKSFGVQWKGGVGFSFGGKGQKGWTQGQQPAGWGWGTQGGWGQNLGWSQNYGWGQQASGWGWGPVQVHHHHHGHDHDGDGWGEYHDDDTNDKYDDGDDDDDQDDDTETKKKRRKKVSEEDEEEDDQDDEAVTRRKKKKTEEAEDEEETRGMLESIDNLGTLDGKFDAAEFDDESEDITINSRSLYLGDGDEYIEYEYVPQYYGDSYGYDDYGY